MALQRGHTPAAFSPPARRDTTNRTMNATDLQHRTTVITGNTDPSTAHAIQVALLDFLEAGGVTMGDDGWPEADVSLSELTLDQHGELEVVLRQHGDCGFSVYTEDAPPNADLSDEEFRSLMDLMMCSDPYPVEDGGAALKELLIEEANVRGYEAWTEAYHEFGREDDG